MRATAVGPTSRASRSFLASSCAPSSGRALVRSHEAARPVSPYLVVQRLALPAREVPHPVVRAGLLQRRIRTLLGEPLALALLTRGRALVLHRDRTLGR
jgi:hypothetical protein